MNHLVYDRCQFIVFLSSSDKTRWMVDPVGICFSHQFSGWLSTKLSCLVASDTSRLFMVSGTKETHWTKCGYNWICSGTEHLYPRYSQLLISGFKSPRLIHGYSVTLDMMKLQTNLELGAFFSGPNQSKQEFNKQFLQ